MNHFIPLAQAVIMTTRYRNNREEILKEEYKDQNILCLSETFDRAAIEGLLQQPGCTSIRIYYGMDEQQKVHAVLVGVNAANEDILDPLPAILPNEDAVIVELGNRCPTNCPADSPLNT